MLDHSVFSRYISNGSRWYPSVSILTLNPVAGDWTQEVWVESTWLLNFVQKLPDVHHLK